MKINHIVINECISNEMKFFVSQGHTHDVENRWFGWADVIEMVMDHKFTKGVHCITLHHDGNSIEKESDADTIENYIEDGIIEHGDIFYDKDGIKLVHIDECTYVIVK